MDIEGKKKRKEKAHYCPDIRRHVSFRCFEAKVDGSDVFTDDDTGTRIVSTSKEEVVGGRRHAKDEIKSCAQTDHEFFYKHIDFIEPWLP